MNITKGLHLLSLMTSSLKHKYVVIKDTRHNAKSPNEFFIISCKTPDVVNKFLTHKTFDWVFRNKKKLNIWKVDSLNDKVCAYRLNGYKVNVKTFLCIHRMGKLKVFQIFRRHDATIIFLSGENETVYTIQLISCLKRPPQFIGVKQMQNLF